MKPKRGFTLTEVLVSLALFSLLSGIILAVFILAHRYSRLYQQVSQAQREAVSCMQGIARELVRGHNQTFPPLSVVNGTWFLSSKTLDGNVTLAEFDSTSGELLWQKWVGIWCDAMGEVRVYEQPLVGGPKSFLNVDLTNAPTSLSALTSLPRQRRLGATITSLIFTRDSRLVTVELLSETTNPGNPITRYQLSSSFSTQ